MQKTEKTIAIMSVQIKKQVKLMKKIIVFLLVLLMLGSAYSVIAEVVDEGSKFESVMLKKGTLIVKEFIDCCVFEEDEYFSQDYMKSFSDALQFQTASVLDVETGTKVYALRMTAGYYKSDYDNGETVGVLDADEIDGAIKTLEYIKSHQSELKDYSEVIYTASSGMEIGAYHSGAENKLFVKVSPKATKFYSITKIDNLIQALQTVEAALGQ